MLVGAVIVAIHARSLPRWDSFSWR